MVDPRVVELSLPKFQYRFMSAAGNVIFPANFHPVGTQRGAQAMVQRARADGPSAAPGEAGLWLVVGGSGGFGSAARVALACDLGAHTINFSYDAQPQPESGNKIRKIGSPGYHRNLALEKELRGLGLEAWSHNADAFDPQAREELIKDIRARCPGQKLKGLVWALAAPRGQDPRSGATISSVLKPLGGPATVKTMGAPKEEGGGAPVVTMELPPGSPEEAVATQYVMGGGIVDTWIQALLAADVLDEGFTLLTVSYRGNPLNADIYRNGLIGLAKADLEAHTTALSAQLDKAVNGRAFAVEGPAVVTEASGGIPGVPLYMALVRDVMGKDFEDPLASMRRMFQDYFAPGCEPKVDEQGLIRMDDRELAPEVQSEMQARYDALGPGAAVDTKLFNDFIQAYSQTRGFCVPGVDYAASFDTDEICKA